MKEEEIRKIIHEEINACFSQNIDTVVEKSVSQVLISLGIDSKNPREAQKDFLHLRRLRMSSEELSKHIKRSVVAIILGALAIIFWEGFLHSIFQGIAQFFNPKGK